MSDRMNPEFRRILERATVCRDRVAAMASLARGKRTLDVGCTGARPERGHTAHSLSRHPRIAAEASESLGIDLDEGGVAELQRMGFDAQVADACTCDLGRAFETILAGELIEHLPEPARFLANMRRHLDADGVLVLTTCNPFGARQLWKILRYGYPSVHPEHTAWYDPLTLMRLVRCCGFVPRELMWVREAVGFDLRRLPRLLRRYYSGNFILVCGADGSGREVLAQYY